MDFLLTGTLAIAIFSLFIYVFSRDSSISKRLKLFERALDSLNHNIFALEKEIKAMAAKRMENAQNPQVAEEYNEFMEFVTTKLKDLGEGNFIFKHNTLQRLDEIEAKLRHITTAPSNSSGADEAKIISLFQSGFGLEEIAKQLRIGTGEVEFVLKLNDVGR